MVLRRVKKLMKYAVTYAEDRIESRKAVRARIQKVREENKSAFYEARYHYISYFDELALQENLIMAASGYGETIDSDMLRVLRFLATDPAYARFEICLVCHKRKLEEIRACLKRLGMDRVKTVVLSSDEYFRILATAKYLIDDREVPAWWVKKEGQKYLHICQGTPVEYIGRRKKEGYAEIGNIQRNYFMADALFFSGKPAMECELKEYMLGNLAQGTCLVGSGPRNEVFTDPGKREEVRRKYDLEGKRVYAYLPVFRGEEKKGKLTQSDALIVSYICQLNQQMAADEVCYVKLHPLVEELLHWDELMHIRRLPQDCDLYEFLTGVDAMATDYSPVLFDYPMSGKKQVLFPFDYEWFEKKAGCYYDLREFPFPLAETTEELLSLLRSEKQYDETAFIEQYGCAPRTDATKNLCDGFFHGDFSGLQSYKIPDNGKKNILIYLGNLARNGITRSAKNLFEGLDTSEHNYFVAFSSNRIKGNEAVLKELPEQISYVGMAGYMQVTLDECYERFRFLERRIGLKRYLKKNGHRIRQEWQRVFADIRLDTIVQFNGYDTEMTLLFSMFEGDSVIFVHNDMVQEIRTRRNQRKDVLSYAYRTYGKVAVVTEDLIPSTASFINGNTERIRVCRNRIDVNHILNGALKTEDAVTAEEVYPSRAALKGVFHSEKKKFISLGRFSPEKGHFRLLSAFAKVHAKNPDTMLVIAGGVALERYFQRTVRQVEKLGLTDCVVLVRNMPNPFPLLKACDYFVLSSFYEGFGLVIAEADVLGKPIVSTDVVGPRGFLKQHGGRLVEDSENGIYEGMQQLLEGNVPVMNVDYTRYNEEAMQEFYSLL